MGQRDTNGKGHGSKVKAILAVLNHLILGFTFGSDLDMHCTIQMLSSESVESHQLLGAAGWHLIAPSKVMLFFWACELRTRSIHLPHGIKWAVKKWPRNRSKAAVEMCRSGLHCRRLVAHPRGSRESWRGTKRPVHCEFVRWNLD